MSSRHSPRGDVQGTDAKLFAKLSAVLDASNSGNRTASARNR
jgi:hypothetical protein